MEQRLPDTRGTPGVPQTQDFCVQLSEITARIKREVGEDHSTQYLKCSNEPRQDDYRNLDDFHAKVEYNDAQESCTSLNCGRQPTFNDDNKRDDVSTKLSMSLIKPVKSEDQHGSEPWSALVRSESKILPIEVKREEDCKVEIEDHGLNKLGKVYDKGIELCEPSESRKHSASDVDDTDKPHAGTFVDTCNIKTEYDADLIEQADSKDGSQEEVFECFLCRYSTTEKDCLTSHVKSHQSDRALQRSTIKQNQNSPLRAKTQHRQHRCTECDFTTKSKHYLTVHMTTKHDCNAEAYKCEACDFTTKWRKYLIRHAALMHSAETTLLQCPECSYTTKVKYYMSRHVRTHDDQSAEVYRCPHCDFATKRKKNLTRHVSIKHDPDAALHKCTHCDFASNYAFSLTEHVNAKHNSDALVFQCAECSYTTKVKNRLVAHFKVHHDKDTELHRCPQCGYATKNKHRLIRHVKIKHDPNTALYRCTLCEFATKYPCSLSKHMTVKHDADAPVHRCDECGFQTKVRSFLTAHVGKRHGRRSLMKT